MPCFCFATSYGRETYPTPLSGSTPRLTEISICALDANLAAAIWSGSKRTSWRKPAVQRAAEWNYTSCPVRQRFPRWPTFVVPSAPTSGASIKKKVGERNASRAVQAKTHQRIMSCCLRVRIAIARCISKGIAGRGTVPISARFLSSSAMGTDSSGSSTAWDSCRDFSSSRWLAM
jgi:hypothetical protein